MKKIVDRDTLFKIYRAFGEIFRVQNTIITIK